MDWAAWILALGLGVAIWQIIELRKSTNAHIAMELFRELRDETTIEKLRAIYNLPYDLSTTEGLERLKNDERENIDYVIDRIDLLGVLVRKGIVNKELAIDGFAGTPSLRCWYRLHKYIEEVRDKRGYFGANLEDFAARSLDHFGEYGIKVKLYWMDEEQKEHKIENLVTELQESKFRPKLRD